MRDVGPISWRGLCSECADRRLVANVTQLHEHHGEAFDSWRRSMAACVGGVLIEDVERALTDGHE